MTCGRWRTRIGGRCWRRLLMANILVLIPMKPSLPDALRIRAHALIDTLGQRERAIGEHQLDVRIRTCPESGDGRPYSAHAAARNTMLDAYLTEAHTHVLWI